MNTRKFQKSHGAKTCPTCKTRTSLWTEHDFNCDVCSEAGATYNVFQDGNCTYEEAKQGFFDYARQEWPTLTEERLEKCWESE